MLIFKSSANIQVGRPKEDTDLDDVEFLLSLKLSLINIAKILGVSRTTLYRWLGIYTTLVFMCLDSDSVPPFIMLILMVLLRGPEKLLREDCTVSYPLKLIRWRFVIHGAAQCSDNSSIATALETLVIWSLISELEEAMCLAIF